MIKKHRSLLFIAIGIFSLFCLMPANGMEVTNKDIGAQFLETDPSCNPAINTDGVCHLANLPKEIQDYIVLYLLFPGEETDTDFKKRLTSFERDIDSLEKKKIKIIDRTIYLNHRKHVIVRLDSYFDKELDVKDIDKGSLDRIAISANKHYALHQHYGPNNSNIRRDKLEMELTQLGLEQKVDLVPTTRLPEESGIVRSKEHFLRAVGKGYVPSWMLTVHDFVLMDNFIAEIVPSSNGKLVAVTTNNGLYLAQKDEKTGWSQFVLFKELPGPQLVGEIADIPENIDDLKNRCLEFVCMPKKVHALVCNNQATKIGIVYKHTTGTYSQEIINVKPEKIELKDYLRSRLVCLNIAQGDNSR